MRTQSLPLVASASWLVWSVLAQAAWAEQRSLLRARRAGEATPLVTLPESLLLQSSDAEQQGGSAAEAQCLSDAEARKEIVRSFSSSHGGYGNALWNSVQESANEVVEDAREAFFATAQKAAATTTAKPVATTTTAMTTMDPTILAKQMKITQDAARARNLLIGMISRAQLGLLNRLNDIGLDLEATKLRAQVDMKAVNHSFIAAKNMPIMASNAAVDVHKIETNGEKLKAALPKLEGRAKNHTVLIASLMNEKVMLEKNVKKAVKLPGAKRRIENNQNTLGAILPRLEKLERRVSKLENRLYDGQINKLVDDTTNKEVVNIMEDVSRGFGRFIANKA